MNLDIIHEICNCLDLKSIVMLHATTLTFNTLCNKEYWKKLYHRCYNTKYYKSKEFTLSQYKYKSSTDDTLILHRKHTDKEYVIMYYNVRQLSKKINIALNVDSPLIFHNKNINTFYPEFSKLSMRKILDLHGNPLTVIPSAIGKMINLKELNLSNTEITELPKDIGLLIKLKSLVVYKNYITTLPKEIGKLTNLTYLDCSFNKITSLPNEINNLTKLKRLYLHDNDQLTTMPDISLLNLKDMSLPY